MEPIILASSSPRRQEILKMLKIPFRVIIPNIDETLTSTIELEQVPELLAREKVTAVIHSLPAGQEIQWVLGADTVILFDGKVIGKPENHEPAVRSGDASCKDRSRRLLWNGRRAGGTRRKRYPECRLD